MNILITDDHQLFRSAFISLLKTTLNTQTKYYEAKNGIETLKLVQEIKIGLVFLDVSMPQMNGYETCKRIRELPCAPSIIMLTQHYEKATVCHFKELGVSFLTKNAEPGTIDSAISIALKGGQFIEEGLMYSGSQAPASIVISKQEKRIITKLASGLSSKEIAAQLNITTKTVDTYRERLLKKLKVKNVAELISFVFKTGNDQ